MKMPIAEWYHKMVEDDAGDAHCTHVRTNTENCFMHEIVSMSLPVVETILNVKRKHSWIERVTWIAIHRLLDGFTHLHKYHWCSHCLELWTNGRHCNGHYRSWFVSPNTNTREFKSPNSIFILFTIRTACRTIHTAKWMNISLIVVLRFELIFFRFFFFRIFDATEWKSNSICFSLSHFRTQFFNLFGKHNGRIEYSSFIVWHALAFKCWNFDQCIARYAERIDRSGKGKCHSKERKKSNF